MSLFKIIIVRERLDQCTVLRSIEQYNSQIFSNVYFDTDLNKCMYCFNVLNKRTRLIKYNDANIMNNQLAYIQNIYVYIHIQLMSTVYYSTCIINLDIRDHNKKHFPLELNMSFHLVPCVKLDNKQINTVQLSADISMKIASSQDHIICIQKGCHMNTNWNVKYHKIP